MAEGSMGARPPSAFFASRPRGRRAPYKVTGFLRDSLATALSREYFFAAEQREGKREGKTRERKNRIDDDRRVGDLRPGEMPLEQWPSRLAGRPLAATTMAPEIIGIIAPITRAARASPHPIAPINL